MSALGRPFDSGPQLDLPDPPPQAPGGLNAIPGGSSATPGSSTATPGASSASAHQAATADLAGKRNSGRPKLFDPEEPPADTRPWDRQPREPDMAWQAFVIYRNTIGGRSLMDIANQLHKARGQIAGWFKRWGWRHRAQQWDRDQDRILQEARKNELEQMQKLQVAMAQTMQNLVAEHLATIQGKDLKQWSVTDIVKFMESAIKLESSIRGKPTEIHRHEHTGPNGEPIKVTRIKETIVRTNAEANQARASANPEKLLE